MTIYAEKDLLATPGMQVMLHHEFEELPVAVSDLIDELRERDAAGDQALASLADVELAQATTGVPDDYAGDDVANLHCLLCHEGPFLAPLRGRSPLCIYPWVVGAPTLSAVYVHRRGL
jgi:hypothetical protein